MNHQCGGRFRREEERLLHGGRLVLETCTSCGQQYIERYSAIGRLILWSHRRVDPKGEPNFLIPRHHDNPNAALAAL